MDLSRIHQIVLESMREVVYIRDLDMNIIYINPASEELTGWSPEEAKGKKCYEVFGDEQARCRDVCPAEKAIAERVHILHHEGSLKTRSGEIHEMQVSISAIDGKQGVAGAVVVMEHITRLKEVEKTRAKTVVALEREIEGRKRVEEALRESQIWMRNIFDSLEEAVLVVTHDRVLKDINPAAERIFGYSKDEVAGRSTEVFHVDHGHYTEFGRRIKDAFDRGAAAEFEFKAKRKNGEIFPTEHSVSLLSDENEKPIGIVSVVRDITERKRSVEEREQALSLLRATLESTADGILVVDTEGKITSYNQEFATMWHIPEDIIESRSDDESLSFVLDQLKYPEDFLRKVRDIYSQPDAESFDVLEFKDGKIFERYSRPQRLGEIIVGRVWSFRDVTKRRQAEDALVRAKRDWEETFDAVSDLIMILDNRYRIIRANKAMADALGVTTERAIGLTCYEMVHGQDAPPPFCPHAKLLADGKPHSAEVSEKRLGGAFDVSVSPLLNQEGDLVGSVHTARDITDRKQSEEALRESEERYRAVFDNAGIGIDLIDRDGRILEVNPVLVNILGYTEEELHHLTFSDITHPDDRGISKQNLEAVTKGDISSYRLEKRYIKKDGSIVWGDLSTSTIRDAKGEYKATVGVIGDITERKRAEENLRDSEARLWDLYDNAPNAYFPVGTDGLIRKCNKGAEELLGYPRDMLEGKRVFDLYMDGPEGKEKAAKVFQKFISGEQVTGEELQMKKADGSPIWISLSVNALRDADGKVVESRSAVVDITERKRSEELALQSVRLKSVADLSSGVAHHFNNLLQIVIGNTSLSLADLESGNLSEIKTNLEQMLQAATLGAETVKRLQSFANMRADVTEGEAAVFDVATTARNAAEVSKPLWKSDPERKGIKIDLQMDLEDGCLVKGQENEIFEALVNLIRNAAESMPQGGEIEVKTYREADEVVIKIRDTGIGIAEEDLPRVFQPFWSTRGVGIGKGMGLAVTYGLVKRHGGTMYVQSAVGKGTTFTIRLPLAQEPVKKTEQPAITPSKGHLTILIIDDDLSIATLLERTCAKAGHSVLKALSGQEGLAIFNKESVEVILCDLGMPGMNGWDVGNAIRSICRDKGITKPPFILLTGWGGQELEKEKIAESGVDAVVAKPIDSATVISTVQEIAARFNIESRVT